MPELKHRKTDFNENWEAEIAAYDESCEKMETDYRDHFLFIGGSGHETLNEEENEMFQLFLKGIPCEEIADQYGIELEMLVGMLEIIRVKLSTDK